MARMLERLKRIVRGSRNAGRPRGRRRRPRSDYERLLEREIADASPERAGELAGHPVERVDT